MLPSCEVRSCGRTSPSVTILSSLAVCTDVLINLTCCQKEQEDNPLLSAATAHLQLLFLGFFWTHQTRLQHRVHWRLWRELKTNNLMRMCEWQFLSCLDSHATKWLFTNSNVSIYGRILEFDLFINTFFINSFSCFHLWAAVPENRKVEEWSASAESLFSHFLAVTASTCFKEKILSSFFFFSFLKNRLTTRPPGSNSECKYSFNQDRNRC